MADSVVDTAIAPPAATEMSEYVGAYSHAPQIWDVSIKDAKLFMKF